MSCSVCRIAFVPHKISIDPKPRPSTDVLTSRQLKYFENATGFGQYIMGGMMNFHYLNPNMFGTHATAIVINLTWETEGCTAWMMHTACANLFRRALNLEDDSLSSMTTLFEIEATLGKPQGGRDAGRFKDVNYEDAGEKVDTHKFWRLKPGAGHNVFNWSALASSPLSWVLSRPDTFPAFKQAVSEARRSSVAAPADEREDLLTTLPTDVLLALLPFLPIPSYLALTSTCRFLRREALTTYQPHARKLVLSLGWAVATKREYAALDERAGMAHATYSPHDADWLLYLSHVHRTPAMRARRWLWANCEEIKRVYLEKRSESLYAVGPDGSKTEERRNLEAQAEQMFGMLRMLAR